MSDEKRDPELDEIDERLGDLCSMSRAEQGLALRWFAWVGALSVLIVAAVVTAIWLL